VFVERLSLTGDLPATWPYTLAPVRALAAEGLEFRRPVTFLVGENGSGKSTLVEAIADVAKINSAVGGKAGPRYASSAPKTVLGESLTAHLTLDGLRMTTGPRRARKGFFLRAETLFDLGHAVSGLPGYWEGTLDERSHGEGFLTVFDAMFQQPGLYLMDEPEAALSFTSCLRLVGLLHQLAATGAQVICATHSPILAALPDADVVELGEHGIRRSAWRELDIVDHWRRYLADPHSYLRHIVDD
jgi:predicted ATPase